MRFRHLLFCHLVLLILWPATGLSATGDVSQRETKAGSCSCAELPHPGDSIWMISTRHLGCPQWKNSDNPDYQVMCYDSADGWQHSTWSDWQNSGASEAVTIVYIHGNRIEWDKAFRRGLSAYRALTRHRQMLEPIRFVIWSWPSDKTCGARRDAIVKANRSDCEGYYFAMFLSQIAPETRVGLIGYSFGSRIVSGALHLVGGGALCGHHLPFAQTRPSGTTRAALLAAAMHNYWWLPGRRHDHTLTQVQDMLVLYNTCDPVLRWYPRIERRSRPQALGYTGCCRPAESDEESAHLEQQNVACQIGKTHDVESYFGSTAIMDAVAGCVLWQLEPVAE